MKKVFVFVAVLLAAVSVFAENSGDVQDQQACEYAKRAESLEVWQKYLEKFPDGICSFEAENEIANLKNGVRKQKSEKSDNPSVVVINNEPVRYYRPYKGSGTALLVIGLLAELVVADALIIGGVANDSDGLIIAGIVTGIAALPIWISGAALLAQKRPVPNQNQKIELSNLSVSPTKGGMFTSVGFRF